jgi:hypothetical protein
MAANGGSEESMNIDFGQGFNPFTIHHSPFTVHRSPFTIHRF